MRGSSRVYSESSSRLLRAIEAYNRFHSPEATARLARVEGDLMLVEFFGPFCESCAPNDWVEDLVFVLRDHGVDAELLCTLRAPRSAAIIGIFRLLRGDHGEHEGCRKGRYSRGAHTTADHD